MIKIFASLFFATLLYFLSLLIATAASASVGTVFAFLLAIMIIEDRIPASRAVYRPGIDPFEKHPLYGKPAPPIVPPPRKL